MWIFHMMTISDGSDYVLKGKGNMHRHIARLYSDLDTIIVRNSRL